MKLKNIKLGRKYSGVYPNRLANPQHKLISGVMRSVDRKIPVFNRGRWRFDHPDRWSNQLSRSSVLYEQFLAAQWYKRAFKRLMKDVLSADRAKRKEKCKLGKQMHIDPSVFYRYKKPANNRFKQSILDTIFYGSFDGDFNRSQAFMIAGTRSLKEWLDMWRCQ